MTRFGSIIASPVLCLAVLAGIALQQRARLRPDDPRVTAYHARAKEAINRIPWRVEALGTTWTAVEHKPETAAVRLLRPNVILSRRYVQNTTSGNPMVAELLIVQCRDSRDMNGHYPPVCYRNIGHELVFIAEHDPIDVGGEQVPFTEYHFEKYKHGRAEKLYVYNFFVVPGRGAVDDIKGVYEAAEDYERRFFGAAQFQILMQDVLSPADAKVREQVFASLLRSHPQLIATLKNDGMNP
jgi:hypothetical protein